MQVRGVNAAANDFTLRVNGPTNLEQALYRMLEDEGMEFVREWTVPGIRFRVDAFVSETRTAYEADGPTHRTRKGRQRDHARDLRILSTGHVDKIIRLTQRQLRDWM